MRDIQAWLDSLGLAHLTPVFEAARIDMELLAELTDAHLRELGIEALGDRMRLTRAIAALRPAPAVAAERRPVTVLDVMADDVETVRALAAEAGGHVEAGDGGATVFFGFPRAQEDAADRAVRLGLALRDACDGARIGIVSGEATVEAGVAVPAGDLPRRAAALRALARTGGLLIAEATRARAGPGFVYRAIDRRRLSDLAEIGPAWQVLGREAVGTRFRAANDGRLTPLVGRQRELDFLIERWRQSKAGEGQVVLLGGEPGIGKSRLAEALIERLRADKPVVFRYQGVAALSNTALHAMQAQVERVSRFQFGDDDATKLEKLRAAMVAEALEPEDFEALADMLALPLPTSRPPLSPDERKRRIFKAIAAQLLAVAQRSPTLILLEDAHWLDRTSIELNDVVAELIRDQPVMMLATHRPGFAAPWVEHDNVTAIDLGTLNAGEAAQMLGALVGGRLPPAVMRRILARAEGNPLHLEELARTVLNQRAPNELGDSFEVPSTLQDSLQARIDQLGAAKPLALAAAAIGREWSVDLAGAVLGLDAAALEVQTQALRESGLAYPVAEAAVPTWTFKHALVRDAAYAMVPPEQRRRLHTTIAEVIRDRFALLAAQRPELLAQHHTAAENWAEAASGWRAAAAQAAAGSAHAEAMSNARRGLELLHRLDDKTARAAGELELRLVLGLGYQALHGFADQAVEIELTRAWTLAEDVGDDEQRAEILGALFSFYFVRGDLARARERAEAGIALARHAGHADREASARAELGNVLFWQGDFVTADAELAACQRAVEQIDSFRPTQGQWDPRVNVHAYRSWTLWMLGKPAAAQASAARAVAQAEALQQPFAASLALLWSFYTLHACGLFDAAADRLAALRNISEARNYPFWRARCRAAEARLCLDRGQVDDAAAMLEESARLSRQTGAAPDRAWQAAIGAELAAARGDTAGALAQFDQVLAAAQAKRELHWEAELHRLRAGLLEGEAAEAALQQALAVAHRQRAVALALRAAVDLAQRLAARGDKGAARDLLRPVLDAIDDDDGGDRGVAAARALLQGLD